MNLTIFEKLELWYHAIPEKGAATLCVLVPSCWVAILLLYHFLCANIDIWKLKRVRRLNNASDNHPKDKGDPRTDDL